MAQGTERRQGATDSLVGASEITPVLPQAPALQIPNASVPDVTNSISAQVMRSVQGFASKQFQAKANVEHEASVLDGQMAYQQGRAMEDLDMPGDKWAMQGYRVMQAQTTASTMLAAQKEMIRQSQYEQDPDAFRATYVNRLEQQLDGLDPQTAKMVREQMAEHMPTLVAQHTTAYMQNEEQTAFDSLAASVHTLSTDETSNEAFVANAGDGPNSGSAGLSADRRIAALAKGTVAAFDQNNPIAYQKMKASGAFDNLPDAERNAIEAAEKSYKARLLATYDEDFNVKMGEFDRQLKAGEFTGTDAVDAMVGIYAQRGIDITAAQASSAYAGARNADDQIQRSAVTDYETARVRGDIPTMSALLQPIVQFHESGNNPNAVSEVGAQGLMQVMPATQLDPGFGITPSDGTAADTARVGKDLLTAMLGGGSTSGILRWEAGDTEAALIAYNAGPKNANAWIAAGRDYASLPKRQETEPYVQKILKSLGGGDLYYTASETNTMSQNKLTSAKKLRDELLKQENIEAEVEHTQSMVGLKAALERGEITTPEYMQRSASSRRHRGLAITQSNANADMAAVQAGVDAAASRAKEAGDTAQAINLEEFNAEINDANGVLSQMLKSPDLTAPQAANLLDKHRQFIREAASARGLNAVDSNWATQVKNLRGSANDATDQVLKNESDAALVAHATGTGTVATLPKDLSAKVHVDAQTANGNLVANAVAAGTVDEEAAPAMLDALNVESIVKAGTFSELDRNAAKGAMSRKLVTPDGNPTPEIMATIMKWDAVRQDNPEVAATLLDEKGAMLAESVLALAGGSFSNPDAIGSAMQAVAQRSEEAAGLLTGNRVVDETRLVKDVGKAVKARMKAEDIGFFQGLFSGDADIDQRWDRMDVEEKEVFSDEARTALGGKIESEALRLQTVLPGQPAEFYADLASRNIMDRTSIVGDNILVMDKGHSVLDQAFGANKGKMAKDGLGQSVLLRSVVDLIASDPDKYSYLVDTSFYERSGLIGRGLLSAVSLIPGVNADSGELSVSDSRTATRRGVRGMEVTSFDGKGVQVRIRLPNGTLTPALPIDFKATGDTMYQEHLDSLTTGDLGDVLSRRPGYR